MKILLFLILIALIFASVLLYKDINSKYKVLPCVTLNSSDLQKDIDSGALTLDQ